MLPPFSFLHKAVDRQISLSCVRSILLGAPMSLAWALGSPHVEDLVLPKSAESGNFTLANAVIQWMSVQNPA
jgi:hypothetical protein